MTDNISAAILAGGENKRFEGRPKTEIIIGGRKIIYRMLDVIRDIFNEIIIVSNSPDRFKDIEKCRIVGDIYPGSGPLGGIHAAMKASENEALFVFAGDMPFLDRNLIISQIEKFRNSDALAMVPVLNNLGEPLHAIYKISLTDEIEKILDGSRKPAVKDFLDKIVAGYMELPASAQILRAFSNINTPSDLERAETYLR
jgi:molybdopterin-guanine dinucleotide biosynthesis protein A